MRQAMPDVVRDFYERQPYPAPLTSLDEHRHLYLDPDRRRAMFHLLWPHQTPRENREILVAGCGTSQAARYALGEPAASVTAIDVSETSLRHTRDLKRKHDLENLEIYQLPIERVAELGYMFDEIVCTGVLHHLPDPDAGLHALRGVLHPRGAMHLMVYAPYGRAGIYMMQEYCRLLQIDGSAGDLRDLGDTLGALPADHPIAGPMRGADDFRHPDGLADALLHPLDRAYSVPQIYGWLDRCGMVFGRWVQQAPYLARCGMVAKTLHAERLSSLPGPLQHAAVELFRGTMVRHSLIAYRDDGPNRNRPLRFDDDAWSSYVPIPMPSAVCIRERVPPGSAAVLINRAHPFPDLALPIDATERTLLDAIDGKRSLAGILELVGKDERSVQRARTFFERLWDYDQVVFDASRAA